MSVVNLYRLFCVTEGLYKTVWGTEDPTKCPDNTADAIDVESITIIKSINGDVQTIQEPTEGYYTTEMKNISSPMGVEGAVTTVDISYPMRILVWLTEFVSNTLMVGDELSVILDPEKVVGTLTSTANSGTNTIVVSIGDVSNFVIGAEIIVGVESVGRCLAKNVNGTITVENILVGTYSPGTTVKMNVYTIRNFKIDTAGYSYRFGEKGFKGLSIEAGTVLRVLYKNNSGLAKNWNLELEFYYGME